MDVSIRPTQPEQDVHTRHTALVASYHIFWSLIAVLLANASPWFNAKIERWCEQQQEPPQQQQPQQPNAGARGSKRTRPNDDVSANATTQAQQRLCVHMDVGNAEDAAHLEAVLKQVGGRRSRAHHHSILCIWFMSKESHESSRLADAALSHDLARSSIWGAFAASGGVSGQG